ncbi:MAG TPA: F0F1 ATP synthase subunit A [Gemmatimonadales bacterium]|nr:F0F1 ATP synthase subunit A [Gemmatimonadales bacterium]
MSRFAKWIGLGAAFVLATAPLAAQHQQTQVTPRAAEGVAAGEIHPGAPAAAPAPHGESQVDILHHIGNSHEIEVPFIGAVALPRWEPLPFTILGQPVDLSPTKHTVFLVLAALLVGLCFVLSGRAVARAQRGGRPPKGFAGAMEAMALYIRQEVILPNVGHHGEGFVPYLLTLFFFILVMNLLGLVPWGATATGNISVTAALAMISFLVIEVAGMRALGVKGYMNTIFFLPPGLPGFMKPVMLVIMTPVEIIGKLAKPFALAVRLFANMTAGHVLVLALLGLTFLFQSYTVGIASSVLATGIMMLEVFVAFLQAYVFTLLTSVFIGLMRAEH